MNFNSLQFLIFLPIVLIVYWLLPHKVRWIWLLAASWYFYMSWNAWLIFLIVATTLASYVSARLIAKTENRKLKKLYLIITLIVCLGALVFFKYFNFLLGTAIDFLNLFSLHIESYALDIILPVGISFYTFQTLSYVIDVYRGKFNPEKHFGYYALFVAYFPQLVAGPIERPENLLPQLHAEHTLNTEDMSAGLRLLLCGFFRKCVVADVCGVYVNNVFNGNLAASNGLAIFLAGALFCIQIYCDFAGYSEIAMGCAKMMGVNLTRNFDRPYLSVSGAEYFRRWHITLNQWFTDYLYIPLGGNRKGTVRKLLNVLIVFGLCGLWHGANWTYVLWGLYVATMINVETLLKKPFRSFCKKYNVDLNDSLVKLIRRAFMFCVVFVPAAILFRAANVSEIGLALSRMYTQWGIGERYLQASLTSLGLDSRTIIQLAITLVCMGMIYWFSEYKSEGKSLPLGTENKRYEQTAYAQRVSVYGYLILAVALCWLALLSSGDVSSFQYFQF